MPDSFGYYKQKDTTLFNSFKFTVLALVGLCLLIYANSLRNAFVYDDIPAILKNPLITKAENLWRNLFNPQAMLQSLNYLVGKENPFIYHLSNIALHSINTILVLIFLRFFFDAEPSFFGAALFAAHPVQAEAVTWITGGGYLLIAFFSLITMILYLQSVLPLDKGKNPDIRRYIYCLLIFSYCIIRNYTFYLVVPFILILSDIVFSHWRKTWKLWLPFLAILAIRIIFLRGIISARINSAALEMGSAINLSNPFPRLVYSLFLHLGLLVWPARLTLFHEPIRTSVFALWLGAGVLLILILASPLLFRKAKEILLAIGIFILFLAPTYSPIVITSLVAERYLYFPSIALCITISFVYQRYALKTKVLRKTAQFLIIFIIAAAGLRVAARNKDWRDSAHLWRKTLEVSGGSAWVHNNMGFVYQMEGNIEGAIKEYRKALEIKPNLLDAYNNLGVIYISIGKMDEAIESYKKAIEINPNYIKAYNNLGAIYSSIGKMDEAIESYKKIIAISPDYAYAYYNLAVIYSQLGKEDEAKGLYDKAVEIDPTLMQEFKDFPAQKHISGFQELSKPFPAEKPPLISETLPVSTPVPGDFPVTAEDYNDLGFRYSNLNRHKEAIIQYKKAIEINPQYADAYNNLGNAYASLGRLEDAIAQYQKAAEINPKHAVVHFNLAMAYFEQKKYLEAVTHADIAAILGYRLPEDFLKLIEPYRKNAIGK